jgi:hypothetical protein
MENVGKFYLSIGIDYGHLVYVMVIGNLVGFWYIFPVRSLCLPSVNS